MRSRRGFTIVELLVAFTVLGLLVAFALNRSSARRRAYIAVVQSDLRTLMGAQETHYAEKQAYGVAAISRTTPAPA